VEGAEGWGKGRGGVKEEGGRKRKRREGRTEGEEKGAVYFHSFSL